MADIYTAPQEDLEDLKETRVKTKKEPEILTDHQDSNPLSSFIVSPLGVRFETQEQEEKIILLLRMHWLTNVSWIILAILLFLAPLILRFFPITGSLPPRYQIMSWIFWYLLVTAFIFEKFLTWFFNIYIITDERVVSIDFYNLLYKQVTDAKIDKIQDVTYKTGGAIRTVFNYGDILMQTAGALPNLEFRAIPQPDRVAKLLQELRTEEEIEALEGKVR